MGIDMAYFESLLEAKFQRNAVIRLVQRGDSYIEADALRAILDMPEEPDEDENEDIRQYAINAIEAVLGALKN